MAITEGNQPATQQFQPGAGVQGQFAQTQTAQASGDFWSFHDQRAIGQNMPALNGNANYVKLRDKLIKMYEQARDAKITVIELDNQSEPSLVYSALLIACRKASEMDLGVAYTVLIVEATANKELPLKQFTFGNNQYPVPLFPGDAWDRKLIQMASERVQKEIPGAKEYIQVDAFVVPKTLNVEDDVAVYTLAANAGVALGTELEERSPNFKVLALSKMDRQSTLVISSQFQRAIHTDAVGYPLRSDVTVMVTSRQRNANQQNNFLLNTGEGELPVTGVNGYIDAAWEPMTFNGQAMPYFPGMPTPTQKFTSRMVITNIVSSYGYTLDRLLLALASTSNLVTNDAWTLAFRPSLRPVKDVGGGIDITDVGALNIDANVFNDASGFGPPIATKDETFKTSDLRDFLMRAFRPGMAVAIDCPEAGPQSWYTSVLVDAARGGQNAYRAIFNAAQALTGGAFERHFQFGTSMFNEVSPGVFTDKIHNGYWEDHSGVKRDIRDFDHVAVCNLVGKNSPDLIREWSDTFYRTQFPVEVRMDARASKIRQFAQERVQFTGRSDRLTFSAAFIGALVAAINETKVNLTSVSPLSAGDLNNNRGVANFASSAVVVPTTALISNGFGTGVAGQAGFLQNMHAYRFGG